MRNTNVTNTWSIQLAQQNEYRLPFLGNMLKWEHFTRTTAGKLCQSNVSKANNDRSPNINVKMVSERQHLRYSIV